MGASGTCDPASRGETYNGSTYEVPNPNFDGKVMVDVRYGWDGVSQMPVCDGPVQQIRTRNTSSSPAWAMLPNKKRGSKFVEIPAGSDTTISAQGQLSNLGLTSYSDTQDVTISYEQPVGEPEPPA